MAQHNNTIVMHLFSIHEYIIDTSSLIEYWGHPNRDSIYSEIIVRIQRGCIKTVNQVLEELKSRQKFAYKLLKPYKRLMVIRNSDMYAPQVLSENEMILSNYRLIDQVGGRNPADSWLIAVSKVYGFTVITNEKSRSKRHKRKIPYVCGRLGVRWINGNKFLIKEGIIDK